MIFLTIVLLFLQFITVRSFSITQINKYRGTNTIINTITMGCDYYIYKYLDITFENNRPGYIELSCDRGYFYEPCDIDEEECQEKLEQYYDEQLQSDFVPIVIYENNNFVNKYLENKYIKTIKNYCNDIRLEMKDIIKIVKNENKILR